MPFPGKTLRPLPKQQPSSNIPPQMAAGIEVCINSAYQDVVSQMEIAIGPNAQQIKRVRIICIPESYGEPIDGPNGKKFRLITVPHELKGNIIETKKEGA